MLNFAAAAYLTGIILITVPLILHLMRRNPTNKVPFPSFMFLEVVKAAASRRFNNLRKWLILLLRMLAIIFLCAAFALPYIPELGDKLDRAVVVLVDNSMSMQALPPDAVKKTIDSELDKLSGKAIAAVGMTGDITVWSGGLNPDIAGLKKFAGNRQPADTASYYESALRQADRILRKARTKEKEIVLITDMQKLPWQSVRLDVPLTPGITLRVVTPEARPKPVKNLWIDKVKVESRPFKGNTRYRITVTAVNGGKENTECKLKVGVGSDVMVKDLKLGENESANRVFEISPRTSPGFGTAILEVNDAIPADNLFYFPAGRAKAPSVLLSPAGDNAVDFVKLALNPQGLRAPVKVKYFNAGTPPAAFRDADRVIVRNRYPMTREQLDSLEQAVAGGGNLILTWDNSTGGRQLLERFGVKIGKTGNENEVANFTNIDFSSPPFAKFLETRAGNLFSVNFYRVPELKLPPGARIAAEFTGGKPAVAEFPYKQGKVMILAFRPDRVGTDWPVRASFLPFWRELLKSCNPVRKDSGYPSTATFRTVMLPDGVSVKRIAGKDSGQVSRKGCFVPSAAGVFRIEKTGGGKPEIVCVNHSPEESKIAYMPTDFTPEVQLEKESPDQMGLEKTVDAKHAGKPAVRSRKILFAFLILAIVCGFGEMLLANRSAL